jgi:hypothetical protein
VNACLDVADILTSSLKSSDTQICLCSRMIFTNGAKQEVDVVSLATKITALLDRVVMPWEVLFAVRWVAHICQVGALHKRAND